MQLARYWISLCLRTTRNASALRRPSSSAPTSRQPCIWWDNNYLERRDDSFGLFDRETLACHSPSLIKAVAENARK